MAETHLRIVTCDYCAAEIPAADEQAATWTQEIAGKRRALGNWATPTRIATVMLCSSCREVVSVAALLGMLERKGDDPK